MPNISDGVSMGTILSFRYQDKPKVFRYQVAPGRNLMGQINSNNSARVIIVLTPGWMGHMHGLKVSGLTMTEQQYLQMIFQSIYVNGTDFFEPLVAQVNDRRAQLEILNKQRQELLLKQQAVVMRPEDNQFGQQPQTRGFFGSVIGKIKTFLRTPKQPVQPHSQDPRVLKEIEENQKTLVKTQQELTQWVQFLEGEKNKFTNLGQVPNDPYRMYHQIIKPLIGRVRMPDIYRKYNLTKVKTPRIIKSPGAIYG